MLFPFSTERTLFWSIGILILHLETMKDIEWLIENIEDFKFAFTSRPDGVPVDRTTGEILEGEPTELLDRCLFTYTIRGQRDAGRLLVKPEHARQICSAIWKDLAERNL